MNSHQRCLQAKVKYQNEPKQVMPKSDDRSRSLEINVIWTFDTEFPTIFNKSCIYITFKSAVTPYERTAKVRGPFHEDFLI